MPPLTQQTKEKMSKALTKLTPDIMQKLKEAFSVSATIEQACFYAGISERTYYNWKEKNPELMQEIEALRNNPDLKAKQTVVQNLSNVEHAWRWLERKDPDFKPKSAVENSGELNVNITQELNDAEKQEVEDYKKFQAEQLRKKILAEKKNAPKVQTPVPGSDPDNKAKG